MTRAIVLAVLLSALALAGGLFADSRGAAAGEMTYKRIPVSLGEPATPGLAVFIARLNKAAKAKDAGVFLTSVSGDFQCLRDFGGVCGETMTAAEKFAAATHLGGGDGNAADFSVVEPLLTARRFEKTTALGDARTPLLCGPAIPSFDEARLADTDKDLFKGDGETHFFNWVAITRSGAKAHSKPDRSSPLVERLARQLVHLDASQGNDADDWLAVDLPSGRKGYVHGDDAMGLLEEQLCYTRHPEHGWQISGFVGGGD